MIKPRNIVFMILLLFFFTLFLMLLSSNSLLSSKAVISDSTPEGYVEVSVKDLQISSIGGVISLGVAESDRVLNIHIGIDQAHTLARVINNVSYKRPMTHDLLEDVLKKSETDIVYISVDKIEAGTYYATIVLRNGEINKIDARPSDSIIIALRRGAPIYVNKDLLEVSGIVPERQEPQRERALSV